MQILIPVGNHPPQPYLVMPGTKDEVVRCLTHKLGEDDVKYSGDDVIVIRGKPFRVQEGELVYYTDNKKDVASILGL